VVGHPGPGGVGEAEADHPPVSRVPDPVEESRVGQVADQRADRVRRGAQPPGHLLAADPGLGTHQQQELDLRLRQDGPVGAAGGAAAQQPVQLPNQGAQPGGRLLAGHRVTYFTMQQFWVQS
jgi:hypothetical protein